MKLDSEGQRDALINMLSTVTATVTWDNARQTADTFDGLKHAIETAEIEEPPIEKDIVPIGDLAPDEPSGEVRGAVASLSAGDRKAAGLG